MFQMEMKNTRSRCSEILVALLFFALESLTCVRYQSVHGIQQGYFNSLSFSNPTVTLCICNLQTTHVPLTLFCFLWASVPLPVLPPL